MAVAVDNSLYFTDGNSIRMVDSHGIIHTIIGVENYKRQWRPIPCTGTLPVNEVKLHWPTDIAISPLDGSLYFIDDHMIFRLTHDRRVMIMAGQPAYCKTSNDKPPGVLNIRNNGNGDKEQLGSFHSFAFGPTGNATSSLSTHSPLFFFFFFYFSLSSFTYTYLSFYRYFVCF